MSVAFQMFKPPATLGVVVCVMCVCSSPRFIPHEHSKAFLGDFALTLGVDDRIDVHQQVLGVPSLQRGSGLV